LIVKAEKDGTMKYRDFTRMLKDNGWQLEKQEGSHQKWAHPEKSTKVTVAGHPNDDIPPGTLKAMLKQAGLK
jgi:predicted RNA binding protein YcfA (HicA-like mRNA interferase family)